jgi:hypothetical protein
MNPRALDCTDVELAIVVHPDPGEMVSAAPSEPINGMKPKRSSTG